MALDFETILAGARASHRVAQIEEQRRELLQRHDEERSAQDGQGEDLARQLQELEVQRARLESHIQAHGQAQQALNQRHEEERDASTAQVQDANEEYIQVVQSAARDSGRTPEQLAEIFDRQCQVLVTAGMLPDAVTAPADSAREPARARPSERGYRRGRRGQTETPPASDPAPGVIDGPAQPEPVSAAPVLPAASEAPDSEATETESPETEAPAPVAQTEPDLSPTPADASADLAPLAAMPTIAEEGARIDAEVEALAQTPARVTLTDPTPGTAPVSENDWFSDVRRVIPPTAVATAAPDIAAPVLTAPTAQPEDDGLSDAPEAAPPVPASATAAADTAPIPVTSAPAPAEADAGPSFNLPGTPAVPAASGEIDGFDELERQFGGKDIDFDVPGELR